MPNPRRTQTFQTILALPGLALCLPALAFNYVADAKGTFWGIQDAAPPRVDTGSIRATQIGAGQTPALSTSINGFGGIRVWVQRPAPVLEPRFNGELMRGFGLQFDGTDRFTSTQSVDLAGVAISRAVAINRAAGYGRWLDTFTNTTPVAITIKVAFGGQSGIGFSGGNSSAMVGTSSGDTVVAANDAWAMFATPLNGNTLVGGPQITVFGSPAPFSGALSFAGNWLHDSFNSPLVYGGHEGNFQAYVHTLTLPPHTSKSLLHFVVLGPRVNTTSSAEVRASVEQIANGLVAVPAVADLSPAEVCSIANFEPRALPTPASISASAATSASRWLRNPPCLRPYRHSPRRATTWWASPSPSCAPTCKPGERPPRRSPRPTSTASPSTTAGPSASTVTRSWRPMRWNRRARRTPRAAWAT